MTSKFIPLTLLAIGTHLVCPHYREMKHQAPFLGEQSQSHMGTLNRKKCGLSYMV